MGTQNTKLAAVFSIIMVASFLVSSPSFGQSNQYKRKSAAPAAPAVPGAAAPAAGAKADDKKAAAPTTGTPAPGKESEKLDITDLEQKYWAPKDTDFSVVQNRTYTKAKRVGLSFLTGPIVNDPWNEGFNYGFQANYYLDERYGFELTHVKADLEDSESVKKFRKLSGGGVRPDYNREVSFTGIGFNWVPFYAKMSFLGRRIIYFDMQFTPVIGTTTYEQLSVVKNTEKDAFTYGFDITQYFFFSQHVAVRANLQNRYYKQDVLGYTSGAVQRKDDNAHTQMFLMGITYFF